MAFSDDAIGFYLQLDDQLSPALATAETNYGRFVTSLEKFNKRAFTSANSGMEAIAEVVESFAMLPAKAEKSYKEALTRLRARMKPITQMVRLEFSPGSIKGLTRAISAAVAKVLSKVNIRLSATMPIKKTAIFDTAQSLRAAYKSEAQPPDMRGRFQGIPKFAEGGEVTGGGGKKGIDDILAMLSEGEIVLPIHIADALKAATGKKKPPAWLSDALAEMLNEKVAPMIKKNTAALDDFDDEGDRSVGIFENLFTKILGSTRFLALNKALEQVQGALTNIGSAGSQVADDLGATTEANQGLLESVSDSNRILGLSRKEMFALASDTVALANAQFTGLVATDELGQGLLSLTQAGLKNKEQLKELAPVVAMLAKTTFLDPDSAAQSLYQLTDAFGLSKEQAVGYFGTLKNISGIAAVDVGELNEQMQNQMENLGAFFTAKNLSPDQVKNSLEALSKTTAALSENWTDTGGAMADMMAQALGGNIEAQRSLELMGLSFADLQKAVVTGDMTGVMQGMTDNLKDIGGNEQQIALLAERLEFSGTPQQLAALIKNGDKVNKTLRDLGPASVEAGDSMGDLKDRAADMISWWGKLKNTVSTSVSSGWGLKVIEFFDGFSIAVAQSAATLAKEVVELGIFAVKAAAMSGSKKAQQLLATAANVTEAGSKATLTAARVANTAAATAEATAISTNAVATTAAAPANATFAASLLALAPAIPVIIVLTLAIIGIAFAIRLVTPLFTELFKVLMKGMDTLVDLFGVFQLMTPAQMLASVGSLALLGIVLPQLGAGVLAFSVLLGAAAPGLLLFGGALGLLGGLVGASGVNDTLLGLMDIFTFDPAQMDAALAGVDASVRFITSFAALSTALAALAVGGLIATGAGAIADFFGVNSPLSTLVGRGKEIVGTLKPLMAEFADLGFGSTKVDIDAGSLKQELASPLLSVGDIQKEVTVKLDPDTTDIAVRDAIVEQTVVLSALLSSLGFRGGQGGVRPGSRSPDDETRSLARGIPG